MDIFEQKLLETGSLELIASYVNTHKQNLSAEFKEVLANKVKGLYDALDCPPELNNKLSTEEILEMYIENFWNKFYAEPHTRYNGHKPRMPQCFFTQCKERHLHTVKDLLQYGKFDVRKMRNVGPQHIKKLEEAFENAGIDF